MSKEKWFWVSWTLALVILIAGFFTPVWPSILVLVAIVPMGFFALPLLTTVNEDRGQKIRLAWASLLPMLIVLVQIWPY